MSKDLEQQVWQIADKMRAEGCLVEPESVLNACAKEGLEINLGVLRQIVSTFGRWGGEYCFPLEVAQFIGRLVGTGSPKRILDPSAGLGFLAIPIHTMLQPECFEAYSVNQFHAEIWSHLADAGGISFHQADGLEALTSGDEKYDAIVSCPPFNVRSHSAFKLVVGDEETELHDNYAHLLLLEACLHLAPGGVAAFVLSNSYFRYLFRGDKARNVLSKLGFRTTAAIELPPGTFAPHTNIATHIVIQEREESGSGLFTGRFSPDKNHQEILLGNLQKRVEGKTPEQGRIVAENVVFEGFSAIELSERLVRAAKRHRLTAIPFSKVVRELHAPKSTKTFEGFENKHNAVYLPQMASTKATTRQEDLPEKLKSYFQLVVNPELAKAEFLAGLLNTSFGQLWRDSLRSGTTIPRISKNLLEDSMIYLPETGGCEVQQEVVECQNHLTRLRTEVRELETRLWERPLSVQSIEKSVKAINREDRYEDWLETLPFPVASILWSCHTQTGSPKEKYERKLHFFEALAEFLGVVHLSAFSSSSAIWGDAREPLNVALQQGKVSLEMATFGTWAIIVGFFSKRGRVLLAKEEELVFELFKTRNRELLGCLLSKKLVSLIQEANKVRNDWLGHTGIVSDGDATQVNALLDQKMQAVREVFGLVWEEYQLLLPGDCRFTDGSFEYRAKKVMGTRTPFPTDTITATEAMEDGHLYLRSPDETRGLKLLPFVKVLPSPRTEENACYFYNRRDKKGIRFLSYYFEGDSEIVDEFGDVALALGKLGTEIDLPTE